MQAAKRLRRARQPTRQRGVTPTTEVAFANGVDSTYVLCDDQYVIDRRPMHEEWIDSGGGGDFVNNRDPKNTLRERLARKEEVEVLAV